MQLSEVLGVLIFKHCAMVPIIIIISRECGAHASELAYSLRLTPDPPTSVPSLFYRILLQFLTITIVSSKRLQTKNHECQKPSHLSHVWRTLQCSYFWVALWPCCSQSFKLAEFHTYVWARRMYADATLSISIWSVNTKKGGCHCRQMVWQMQSVVHLIKKLTSRT